MSKRRRRRAADRNLEPARTQADTAGYETQDIRPDYERSRTGEARREEQADVEEAREVAEKD